MHETLTRQRDDLLRQLQRANARISCLETQERNAGTLAVAHLERALDAERNLARLQQAADAFMRAKTRAEKKAALRKLEIACIGRIRE